ncbi:hypothetical protein D3C80_109960 [compost metagenome]
MRGDAQLGILMHLASTNLNFHRFAAGTEHHGMNRLVAVRFWVSDVIIELIRQMTIVSMYYPQRGVAVLQALSDDTHRPHVKQLIKGEMLFLHFAPDAVDVLRPAVHFGLNAFRFHF